MRARFFALLLLLAVGLSFAWAQAPQPQPTPAPQVAAQPEEPEHTITKAEADELFRSVDEILAFASRDTGLPIRHPVKRRMASRAEVQRYLQSHMDEADEKHLERAAITLKKLGLVPREMNLRSFLFALLGEQVAGFYDAKTRTVNLLDWVEPEAQKPVLAHELTHALQDQNYGLEKWADVQDKVHDDAEDMARDEARGAREAVTEGQATLVMIDYLLAPAGRKVEDSPEIVAVMKSGMTDASSPLMSRSPLYLREALLFPYSYGMDFVLKVLLEKGRPATFAGLMERPPADTHQVMQAEAFLRGDAPETVAVAELSKVLGHGWERIDMGGLGELDARVMVAQWANEKAAVALAPAFSAGYYMTFQRKGQKNGAAYIALITRWRSTANANDFAAIYRDYLPKRYRQVNRDSAKPDTWLTEDGPVQVVVQGAYVLATETFDEATAARLREAMLSAAQNGGQKGK